MGNEVGADLSFLMNVKNALYLLAHGEGREFIFRLRVRLGQIDLETADLDQLNLREERSYHYVDSGGLHLEMVLRTLNISSRDAIIDFGSGKGGALFTFSKYPFSRITGCEISPELAAVAEKNIQRMRVGNVTFAVMDAAAFTDLDDYNYFYFFNPFPCTVMRAVMTNIASSLARRERKAIIIYCNPECHQTIISGSPFHKAAEHSCGGLTYFVYTNQS